METRSEQDGLLTELCVLNPSPWQQHGQGVPPASHPAPSPPAAAAGDFPVSTPAALTELNFSVKGSDGNRSLVSRRLEFLVKKGVGERCLP